VNDKTQRLVDEHRELRRAAHVHRQGLLAHARLTACVLWEDEGLGTRDIAAAMGISVGHVEWLLARPPKRGRENHPTHI
jgi:hypothetical protein